MKNSQENLESLIEAINELLNEVRKEQIMENKNAEKRHKACMQNLSKLREYNKIADMTNQIFENKMMFRFLHAFIYLFLFIANVTKYIAPEIITIIGPVGIL